MQTIIVSHVCPPIPTNDFDYCACYDGEQEEGIYGYGCTEKEAIKNLRSNYGDYIYE
jgi:hypothetical protein